MTGLQGGNPKTLARFSKCYSYISYTFFIFLPQELELERKPKKLSIKRCLYLMPLNLGTSSRYHVLEPVIIPIMFLNNYCSFYCQWASEAYSDLYLPKEVKRITKAQSSGERVVSGNWRIFIIIPSFRCLQVQAVDPVLLFILCQPLF